MGAGMVGADLQALLDLAGQFARAGSRLEQARAEVTDAVRRVEWGGADAQGAVASWAAQARVIDGAVAVLTSAATEIRTHHGQQADASAADSARPGGGRVVGGAGSQGSAQHDTGIRINFDPLEILGAGADALDWILKMTGNPVTNWGSGVSAASIIEAGSEDGWWEGAMVEEIMATGAGLAASRVHPAGGIGVILPFKVTTWFFEETSLGGLIADTATDHYFDFTYKPSEELDNYPRTQQEYDKWIEAYRAEQAASTEFYSPFESFKGLSFLEASDRFFTERIPAIGRAFVTASVENRTEFANAWVESIREHGLGHNPTPGIPFQDRRETT